LTRGGRAWSQVGNPPVARWRHALLGVVVERQLDLAFGAGPQAALVVRDDDVDSPVLDGQVHVVDEPGVDQTEHLSVELDVAHSYLHPTGLRILPERHPKCRSLESASATDEPGVKGRARPEREPKRQRRLAAALVAGARAGPHPTHTSSLGQSLRTRPEAALPTPTPGFAREPSDPRY